MKRMTKVWGMLCLAGLLISLYLGVSFLVPKQGKIILTFGMFSGNQSDVPNDDCYKIIDETIKEFEKEYPNAKVIKLEQNYRSTSTILNAANEVIRHNTGRKEKSLWTENGEGEKIQFRQFDSAYDEADYIVSDIKDKVNSGKREYKDFAILYRTNAQSRIFEEKMVVSNVPYKIVGGVNFYARREIKDLLAYLKTVDNGKDDLAVRRIINVPKRGIGLTTIGRVQDYATEREISFYEAILAAGSVPGLSLIHI